MESVEPMTFNGDDVPMDFDDWLSAAALQALAELSKKPGD